jgi:hypothetical protein
MVSAVMSRLGCRGIQCSNCSRAAKERVSSRVANYWRTFSQSLSRAQIEARGPQMRISRSPRQHISGLLLELGD